MESVAVAKIVGCFGVKGLVKLLPLGSRTDRFDRLRDVEIGPAGGERVPDRVEQVVHQQGRILVKFKNAPDRTAAEAYVGKYLFVAGREVVPPGRGAYFVHDVIGCEVWSTDGVFLGVVDDVYKQSSQDLWAVKHGPHVHLIPAVKEFIARVDIDARRITVRLIEGLVEE